MADSLDAYFAEVRAVEDEAYSHFLEGGSIICASFWDGNPDKLKEIDRRHGVRPDDPRVYSIAAYLAERKLLFEEWACTCREKNWSNACQELPWFREYWDAQRRHNVRLNDCKARHFPGLGRGEIKTIPNLWAHVTHHLMVVAEQVHLMQPDAAGSRPTTCDEDVAKAYTLLHRLKIPWAPAPPYASFTQGEAMDALTEIANHLERDDAARCERQTAERAYPKDAAGNLGGGEQTEGDGESAEKSLKPSRKKKGRVGKRPLEESDPLKFQIYQNIIREHQPGRQHVLMVNHLKSNKDFVEQVREVGLKLDSNLVRKALAFHDYRKREARKKQETDSA